MSISKTIFGQLPDGAPVEKYTLKNKKGMSAEFLTYGCRIAGIFVPDRGGKFENVVLGHDTFAEYTTGDVFGAAIGRFANRIEGAQFEIEGKKYNLVKNERNNSLHSAPGGFQDRLWTVAESDDSDDAPSITFTYTSPDGECGFPGNLEARVCYTVSTDNALIIDYTAVSDAETPINLTNHSYFNISGNAENDVLSQKLQINAEKITLADDALIPTGEVLSVAATPYDFRKAQKIGQHIADDDHFLKLCGGYDNNYVLSGPAGLKKAAKLYDSASGRKMLVFTDLPGIQVYSANSFSEGQKGCGGVELKAHHAVCLETQFFPDSVHHPEFPYENLKPGKTFRTRTIFKFLAE